jgi:nicotinamide riboside kinase
MDQLSILTQDFIKSSNVKAKIAILGSPGSGKSTLSSGLLYFSKLFRFKSDSVPEVAKWDIYKKVDFSTDKYERNKFKRQKNLEKIYPNELEITICEAPLIISAIYSEYYRGKKDPIAQEMLKNAEKHKNDYTHFFVTRKLVSGNFEDFGRNEDEKTSEALHQKTLEILERLRINYTVINKYDDHVPLQILKMIGAIQKK